MCFIKMMLPIVFVTLFLHDALPILHAVCKNVLSESRRIDIRDQHDPLDDIDVVDQQLSLEELMQRSEKDRKSTRLNSSHVAISYAVFCLKKKMIVMVSVAAISITFG